MNIFLMMVAGCLLGGAYAIYTGTFPIAPRRKLIEKPAKRFGIILIAVPPLNAVIFFGSRWISSRYYADSPTADHWSMMLPLIVFPSSIAITLTFAKRWSVPKHYNGSLADYKSYKSSPRKPDFSVIGNSDKESLD